MFYLKIAISVVLIITFYGFVLCNVENINEQLKSDDINNGEQLNETLEVLIKNFTEKTNSSSRSGRVLLTNSRTPTFSLRQKQPIKIRVHTDHFPMRPQIRRVYNGLPNIAPPQPQNVRFGYESLNNFKNMPSSKGANPVIFNNGKATLYRPQLSRTHPNSIHVPALSQQYINNFKASPVFNGQVVIHPVNQAQQKQSAYNTQANNFPKYVRPQAAIIPQQQQQNPEITQYPAFKQYPIPDQEKMQKYNEQHEKYLQQQKYLTPKNPMNYYQMQQGQAQAQQQQLQTGQYQYMERQQQQQQQQSIPINDSGLTNRIQTTAFTFTPTMPHKMYSVYEKNDMTELQNNNHPIASYQDLGTEAQEYMRFINTNEYFLPKKHPNYKQIDEETNRGQYDSLKSQTQQGLGSYKSNIYHTQSNTYQWPQQTTQYSNNLYSDPSTGPSNSYNQFYQQDPSASEFPSSVLRTSYQAGYSQSKFTANNQDKKVSEYKVLLAPQSDTQGKQNLEPNRTPEPLRFEFTERDAMVGGMTLTRAPSDQSRYNSLVFNSVTPTMTNLESSTISSVDSKHSSAKKKTQKPQKSKQIVKPIKDNNEDDPEDGEDIQESKTNLGRQPIVDSDSNTNKESNSTDETPSEQKDTEQYCERICAIVDDENEEIVCGSDGYMYTSETQMDCYASCLHIDITIQGKGSCLAR